MKQRGFTLIEIIVVIVILGILAAVALPKFIDLTSEALDASTQGVAGALSSASAINYGAFAANSSKAGVTRLNQANVCSGTTLPGLLAGGALPTQGGVSYTITGTGDCSAASAGGSTVTCSLTGTKGSTTKTNTFTVVCTG